MPGTGHSAACPAEGERLFDSHAHFFTDDLASFPLDAFNTREGEAALTARILTDPGTPERVFAEWDAVGIASGAAVQYNNAYKTDNSYAIHVGDRHPERLSTVVILDPLQERTPDEVERLTARHNVTGLRIVGFSDDAGRFDWLAGQRACATFQAAAKAGIALVVMFRLKPGETEDQPLARLRAIARDYPHLAVVLDHFGWPTTSGGSYFGQAHRDLAGCDNVHFKFTTLNQIRLAKAGLPAQGLIHEAVALFGTRRIMWGSDFGNTLQPYSEMADSFRMAVASLAHDARQRLCHDNAAALFRARK